MKKNTKRLLTLTVAAFAGMYAYNRFVDSNASRKNLLKTDNGHYYKWKEGNIFYSKIGNGAPILLIHDIDSRSSGEEWAKINKKLAKNYTVYTIDLLGCRRSDKPSIKYTNYMYVQIITSFVKNVIKEKANVAATNLSAAPVIMANNLDSSLFNKIILINPAPLKQMEQIPDRTSKFKQSIINMPVIGTFIYNKLMTPIKIDFIFRKKFFSRSQLITSKIEDTYYQAAHSNNSNGKYLYSSILSNYININMYHAIKNINTPINIIASADVKNNLDTINTYHSINSNFEITHISNSKLYPQIEIPEKITGMIRNIIK